MFLLRFSSLTRWSQHKKIFFFFYLGPSQKQVCFQANFSTACFVVIILKLSKPKQTGPHFGSFDKLIVDHNFIQSSRRVYL